MRGGKSVSTNDKLNKAVDNEGGEKWRDLRAISDVTYWWIGDFDGSIYWDGES